LGKLLVTVAREGLELRADVANQAEFHTVKAAIEIGQVGRSQNRVDGRILITAKQPTFVNDVRVNRTAEVLELAIDIRRIQYELVWQLPSVADEKIVRESRVQIRINQPIQHDGRRIDADAGRQALRFKHAVQVVVVFVASVARSAADAGRGLVVDNVVN